MPFKAGAPSPGPCEERVCAENDRLAAVHWPFQQFQELRQSDLEPAKFDPRSGTKSDTFRWGERDANRQSRAEPRLPETIYGRAIAGTWNRFAGSLGGFQPGGLCDLRLAKRFLRCLSTGGTHGQVRDIRDVAVILFTEEDVDVVILHSDSSNDYTVPLT
jgi:hypothetical protein